MRPPAELIHRCAMMSQDIYRQPGETEAMCETRFRYRYQQGDAPLIVWIHEPSTETCCAIVFAQPHTFWSYVVFRGTESVKVSILDAEAIPTISGWHFGLYSMWSSVRKRVCDGLCGVRNTNMLFTGHSAGGANAVAGYDAYSGSSCITFGEPRNMVRHRANWLRKYATGFHLRVVNYLDIVPRVPEWPFWHSQNDLLQFGVRGGHHWNPGWHKRAWWFVKGMAKAVKLWLMVELNMIPREEFQEQLLSNHHCSNYVRWTTPKL